MKNKIPPFRLVPKPKNDEAKQLPTFKWADDEIGTRHQLGGSPNFLQEETWPLCPECSRKMLFYAQLDSLNDEFCIADCGMIYIFLCLNCNEVHSFIQSN
jgi:hypothetical protein